MSNHHNRGAYKLMAKLEELFLHTKPSRILVQLNHPNRENYTAEIASEVGCTYSHAVRVVQKMEKEGLVHTHREGRKKPVELTQKGREIAEPLSELIHLLDAHE